MQKKQRIMLITGLLFGIAMLLWALQDVDLKKVGQQLLTATQFWFALPFILSLLVFFWAKALRWGYLLNQTKPGSLTDRLYAVIIGYTGNLVLPAQLGEIVRTYVLLKRTANTAMPILTSIALERVFDLAVMLFMLIVAMLASTQHATWMLPLGYTLAGLTAFGIIVGIIYLRYTATLLTLIAKLTAFLPSTWQQQLLDALRHGAAGMAVLHQPALLIKALLSSVVCWLAMAFCTQLALWACGIDLPFNVSVFILVLIIGGMMLPASPGFIGTIQACFVLVLQQYQISDELAVTASLFYHLFITLPILLIGYVLIVKMGWSTRQMQQQAQQELQS